VAEKVTFIERLEVDRKRLDHHALYYLSSTESSVELLIKDFANG